jgi:hypothetical protein
MEDVTNCTQLRHPKTRKEEIDWRIFEDIKIHISLGRMRQCGLAGVYEHGSRRSHKQSYSSAPHSSVNLGILDHRSLDLYYLPFSTISSVSPLVNHSLHLSLDLPNFILLFDSYLKTFLATLYVNVQGVYNEMPQFYRILRKRGILA